MTLRLLSALSLSLLVACGPNAGGDDGSGNGGGPDGSVGQPDARPPVPYADAAPQATCDKMDILFVIDNSGSMGEEQDNLASNFPQFISVLDSFTNSAGQPIDYHVGVTTTGVSKDYSISAGIPGFPNIPESQSGDDGKLLTGNSCGMTRRWIERSDANVSSMFSCVAGVGTNGPSDEMPLEGMRLAMTERMSDNYNAGFMRDDALLAVVILTDENDCSREDNNFTISATSNLCDQGSAVADYVATLDTVKGSRDRWAAAIIAGTGPGACSSSFGSADEATRLLDFAQQTGTNAVTSSICEGDLSGALGDAMAKFQEACNAITPVE
jgi:hypothetical protein